MNDKTVNEAEEISFHVLEQVKSALPELEKLILKESKVKVKLKANISRKWNIEIASDDLHSTLSPLGKTVFSNIRVRFWGGQLTKEGTVWFSPKLEYEHPSGGSNGTDFVWDSLWYNLETYKWIEGRTL